MAKCPFLAKSGSSPLPLGMEGTTYVRQLNDAQDVSVGEGIGA